MNSLFDTKISYYSNVEDNVGKEISLRDFLFCDRYKEQIEAIRSITDENVQKSLKKQLPLATISGIFAPTRKAVNLVAHSNLLCIDIDKKDNMGVSWFDDMISSALPILKSIVLSSRPCVMISQAVDWSLTNHVKMYAGCVLSPTIQNRM